jgi:hypothetical protein
MSKRNYKRLSIEEIKRIKSLRQSGLSINEIVLKLSLPKTTIWAHIQNVKVSKDKLAIIRSRQGGSTARKELNIKNAKRDAENILNMSKDVREMAIIISMLHWAEGSKKECVFINSDGKMISVYLFIIRNVFKIPEEYIQPTMRFFTGMDKSACLEYWSKMTKIPKNRFVIRYNDGGIRCRTQYGMCRLTIKKGHKVLKLLDSLKDLVSDNVLRLHSSMDRIAHS